MVLSLLAPVGGSGAAEGPAGIKPLGLDGRPLNLDFETGTLQDWTATGTAFDRQPIQGDTVTKRRQDMRSNHQGRYWIGSYEIAGDAPQGTLTSAPFKITHRWASFLVGGGPHQSTKVELLLKEGESERPIFRATGQETEDMQRVVANLTPYVGQTLFLRLVDQHGGHWGHINFDDFLFHEQEPSFPKPPDAVPPLDLVRFAGLPADRAATEAKAPPGFALKAFAAEPDVRQPIGFAIDDRGRLWVAEAYNYPLRAPEGEGQDRILIFEDTDGDGRFDRRTVFIEKLNLVSGLEVGFGGVWVGAAPMLMFIPDRNRDDVPDGAPEILLDGWGWQDTHETLNTFTWGPDGWLYGCHGVFTHSNVGKPGTPKEQRQRINAGVWRYHPVRHVFEVFAEGTSNPWGIDFDAHGQCFIEACVIPHLFHIIQGARYHRQAGQHFNPHTYNDIKTIGDHVHWAGNRGPHAGNARSDAAGGGHAHAGLLIYQGDSWPEAYRGKVFMNNLHGQRLNMDILERKGSGFVGRHGPDFIHFNDRWSQILNLLQDQDGSVYLIDWYDKNECHHNRPQDHDRSNGRIFKVVFNNQPWTPVDLQKQSDAELVQLLLHRNEWQVRHARRLLQERAQAGRLAPVVRQTLRAWLGLEGAAPAGSAPVWARAREEETAQLRLLWALHVIGGLTEADGLKLLSRPQEYVRAWTIQLLCEEGRPSEALLAELARLAREDNSPVVRLYLASALQRLPVGQRRPVLEGLLARAEDAGDHNLPLMYWYAAEPVVGQDARQAVALLGRTQIPVLRQYITRRMAAVPAQPTAGASP